MLGARKTSLEAMLQSMAEKSYGVVNWFDGQRGFGFVTPDEGGSDVFVDVSDLASASELCAGQRVRYLAGGTRHWPKAEAVQAV
jgi:CspA family cold shock protein